MAGEKEQLEIPKEKKQNINPELVSTGLMSWLRVSGVLYFILSIIASLVLWNSSTKTINDGSLESLLNNVVLIDYTMRALAFFSCIGGIIVLSVCLGISKAIEQNIFIIKRLQ